MPLLSMRSIILVAITLSFALCSISLSDANDCTIKINQDGREIIPSIDNKILTYKLRAAAFRVEVNGHGCSPSISPVSEKDNVDYLLQKPLVMSPMGLGLASHPSMADILGGFGGGVSKATIDEIIEFRRSNHSWAKKEYNKLCIQLEFCPTPVMAYTRYWPFITQGHISYAEFKRWSQFTPLSAAAGIKHRVVVYTHVQSLTEKNAKLASFLIVRPHIIVLDFQQDTENTLSFNRDQSLINRFQVMCMPELSNFDLLQQRAMIMPMKLISDKKSTSPDGVITREKTHMGILTTGPFYLILKDITDKDGKAISCAVAGEILNPDDFRAEAIDMMGLPPAAKPIEYDGGKIFLWNRIILHDFKLNGRQGVMLQRDKRVNAE